MYETKWSQIKPFRVKFENNIILRGKFQKVLNNYNSILRD